MIEFAAHDYSQRPRLSYWRSPLDRRTCLEDVVEIRQHGSASGPATDLSVVIITYKAGAKLLRCLESLAAQTARPSEVIVIDNSPGDSRREELAAFPITYVCMRRNVGPSAGRNLGAVLASGRWLMFVDDDGFLDKDYVANAQWLLNARKDIVCVRGRILPEDNFEGRSLPHYDLGLDELPALPLTEGNLLVSRSAFVDAGGFENDLFGHEGLVLWYRMTRFYGHSPESFRYAPNLVLRHLFYRDENQLAEKLCKYEWLHYWLSLAYPDMRQRMLYYEARPQSPGESVAAGSTGEEAARSAAKRRFESELQTRQSRVLAERKVCQRERQAAPDFTPDFSVIITCYNLGEYLQRALESVLGQTLQNVEIHIVDDASTDEGTIRVLEELDAVVPVIRKSRNEGVAAARNTGIEASRAPCICCLDADDYLHPTYLEKALAHFRMDNEVGIVSCYLRLVGCESGSFNYPDYEAKDLVTDSPVHTASCFRKDACGGEPHYDPSLRGYEDWDHWIRIGKQGWKTVIIPEELFFYFRTPNSKVHTSHGNAAKLLARIIENHRELYEQHMVHVISTKHRDLSLARVALRQKTRQCEDLREEVNTLRGKVADISNSLGQTARDAIVGDNIDQKEVLNRIRQGMPKPGPVSRRSQHQSRARDIPAKLRSLVVSPPFLLAVVMSVIGSIAAWVYLENPITAIAAILAALYIAALICWNSQLNADRVEILQQQLSMLDAMITEVDQRTFDSASTLYRDLGSLAVLSTREAAKARGLLQELKQQLAAVSEAAEDHRKALAEEQDRALANRLQEQTRILASDIEKGLAGLGARVEEQDGALAKRLEEQSRMLAGDFKESLVALGTGVGDIRTELADEFQKLHNDGRLSRSQFEKALAQTVAEISRLVKDGALEERLAGKLEAVSQALRECLDTISVQSKEQAQTAIALDRLNLEFRRQIAQFRREFEARDIQQ